MRPLWLALVLAIGSMALACVGLAQQGSPAGPYKVLKTAKVGGEGGFDYIFADVEGRRLYVPRNGPTGQLTVFNLDTLDWSARLPASAPVALLSTPAIPTTGSPPRSQSPCGMRAL